MEAIGKLQRSNTLARELLTVHAAFVASGLTPAQSRKILQKIADVDVNMLSNIKISADEVQSSEFFTAAKEIGTAHANLVEIGFTADVALNILLALSDKEGE